MFDWEGWVFRSVGKHSSLPNPRVAQECEKYSMRAVFDRSSRRYLIGSGDTLYGSVGDRLNETDLEAAIAELFVTGPFRSIP